MKKITANLIVAAIIPCTLLILLSGPVGSTENGREVDQIAVTHSTAEAAPQTLLQMRGTRTLILDENFDDLPNQGEIPDGWYIYDSDGDGDTWEPDNVFPYEGYNCVTSPYNGSETGDNWLVTPEITVPAGGQQLQFYARHDVSEQPFEIWVCEDGYTPHSFLVDGDLLATDATAGTTYEQYSYWVNPLGLQPKNVYLAIRSRSANPAAMFVDAITLPNAEEEFIGFEGGPPVFPPPGWIDILHTGMGGAIWQLSDGTNTHPSVVTPYSGSYMAEYTCWTGGELGETMILLTPALDFSATDHSYTLEFAMYHDTQNDYSNDLLAICTSLDVPAWDYVSTVHRYDGSDGWKIHTLDLTHLAGEPVVYIGLFGTSMLGNGLYVDDVTVTSEPSAVCGDADGSGEVDIDDVVYLIAYIFS